MVEIRKPEKSRAYSLYAITRHFFAHIGFGVSEIERRLERKDFLYLIAVEEGKTIGFIDLRFIAGKAKLQGIAVLQEFQGKGIGSALLEKGLQECRERKCKSIYLLVGEDNELARRFYCKHGFALVPSRKRFIAGQKVVKLILNI